MTRKEAKEFIAQSVKSDVDIALVADAIKALEQEPCEDKIIEWKKDFKGYINALSMPKDDYRGIMEYIDELPVGSEV